MDVVVVGAGPVGLLHAISEKEHRPAARVVVREKRSEYARDHVIRLSDAALAALRRHTKCARFRRLVAGLGGGVRCDELERRLVAHARSIGVEVRFDDPVTDLAALDGGKVIVAAGARCELLAKPEVEVDNGAMLQVKFELPMLPPPSKGVTAVLNALVHGGWTTPVMRRGKDGGAQLFVAIDRHEYNVLRNHATFRRPATVEQLEQSAFPTIQDVARTVRRSVDSAGGSAARVVAVDTRSYRRARASAGRVHLVGDAAGGVPFQQSFNMACELVHTLTTQPARYAAKHRETWERYTSEAEVKATGLQVAKFFYRHFWLIVAGYVALVCIVFLWAVWHGDQNPL